VGWLDKLKVKLGVVDPEDVAEDDGEEDAPRAARREAPVRAGRGERPPLADVAPPPQQSLDDALEARERGDKGEMLRLLREMDRGGGMRAWLHAAAALEAGDEGELAPLLGKLAAETPAWRVPLQLAAVLGDRTRAAALLARAEKAGAPKWALAWSRALSADAVERRHGLVDLLFADPGLARTVAARDLTLSGAEPDAEAAARYSAFAHGRECIRRFGAATVADLYDRVTR
jgi:hypothetical protein